MMPPSVVTGREESIDAVYGALLHRAHVEGLYGMQVTLLQAPAPENGHTALVRADVQMVQGHFGAIGAADGAEGCSASAVCATAELRAKVRALQDALDAPSLALEPPAPPTADAPPRPLWLVVRDGRTATASVAVVARPHLDLLPGGLS